METSIPLASVQTEPDTGAQAPAVVSLHNRTVDALVGYTTMVEKAEPSFRDTAEGFRALHARHADALARILTDLGIHPDTDGTFMGTVNKAVVTLRAFFDEIDEDVMDQVRSGEAHVLKAFNEAIAEQQGAAHRPQLVTLRAELEALLQDTRHLD